ncbi:MAG: hypothetical protein ACM3N0_02045 [Chloroflexota bacterium]
MLSLGQRLLGSVNLGFQPRPLIAEGIGRNVVALFAMEANQAHLLGLQLGDQRRLGVTHLRHRRLADANQRFDGLCPAGHVLGGQLNRTRAVVAGDSRLDQFGANVGSHLAL